MASRDVAPIQVPVKCLRETVLPVVGDSTGLARVAPLPGKVPKTTAKVSSLPDLTTIGNGGIANGIQGVAPVQVPLAVAGNAGSLVGDPTGVGKGHSVAFRRAEAHGHRGGNLPRHDQRSQHRYRQRHPGTRADSGSCELSQATRCGCR